MDALWPPCCSPDKHTNTQIHIYTMSNPWKNTTQRENMETWETPSHGISGVIKEMTKLLNQSHSSEGLLYKCLAQRWGHKSENVWLPSVFYFLSKGKGSSCGLSTIWSVGEDVNHGPFWTAAVFTLSKSWSIYSVYKEIYNISTHNS